LIGVPFRHQGRDESGLDCAGFLLFLLGKFGYDFVEVDRRYSRNPRNYKLKELLADKLVETPKADIDVTDILLLKFKGPPQHLALVTGYKWGGFGMIHSNSRLGRVTEHSLNEQWKRLIYKAYKFPGVVD